MEHLLIRTDSTAKIGAGHIMRCIALAQAWQAEGGEVTFLSHCESTALRERIQSEGFHFIPVEEAHPLPGDIEQLLATATRRSEINWVVLDGYHFDPEYQKQIRDNGLRLLVIDDMNHLAHYHADIILNQNINGPVLKYSCTQDTTQLLGSRYVLLRREFISQQYHDKKTPELAENILVTMGGADPDNVTLKVIHALQQLNNHSLSVKTVIGPINPHYESIRNELSRSRFRHELLENVTDMPAAMAWADLAISSVGSTTWELLATGVPTVLIITAENQLLVTERLSRQGYCLNLGWNNELSVDVIATSLTALLQSRAKRAKMIQKGQNLIDFRGSARVVDEMLSYLIRVREVTTRDCRLLWEWANEPEVRRMSFNTEFIPFEDHKKWFDNKLSDPRCYQYIAEDATSLPIGQVRFDLKGNEANIGISVASKIRDRGFGTRLLKKALRKLTKHKTIKAVHAYVRAENKSSVRVFEKAGFIVQDFKAETENHAIHLLWRNTDGHFKSK